MVHKKHFTHNHYNQIPLLSPCQRRSSTSKDHPPPLSGTIDCVHYMHKISKWNRFLACTTCKCKKNAFDCNSWILRPTSDANVASQFSTGSMYSSNLIFFIYISKVSVLTFNCSFWCDTSCSLIFVSSNLELSSPISAFKFVFSPTISWFIWMVSSSL